MLGVFDMWKDGCIYSAGINADEALKGASKQLDFLLVNAFNRLCPGWTLESLKGRFHVIQHCQDSTQFFRFDGQTFLQVEPPCMQTFTHSPRDGREGETYQKVSVFYKGCW